MASPLLYRIGSAMEHSHFFHQIFANCSVDISIPKMSCKILMSIISNHSHTILSLLLTFTSLIQMNCRNELRLRAENNFKWTLSNFVYCFPLCGNVFDKMSTASDKKHKITWTNLPQSSDLFFTSCRPYINEYHNGSDKWNVEKFSNTTAVKKTPQIDRSIRVWLSHVLTVMFSLSMCVCEFHIEQSLLIICCSAHF